MSNTLTTINDLPVLICAPDGGKLKSENDALDLIGETFSSGAELIVVPVELLDDDFFQLKTGLAGQILQKIVNYRRRIVILGDISRYVSQSKALRDFVYESNRGSQIWFLADLQELTERLNRPRMP